MKISFYRINVQFSSLHVLKTLIWMEHFLLHFLALYPYILENYIVIYKDQYTVCEEE